MAHKYLSNEVYNNENCDAASAHDLCFSAMACYRFPYMPMLEDTDSTWILPFSDESRDHKKQRLTMTSDDSIGSNSSLYSDHESKNTSSFNSFPRLNFRDHISTYNQRYLAAEAVEEATAAIINAEEEDGSADGMKLVRLLIACAEAVACRDKSHASVLLSDLRANALVHGSSFQRVASCFVQGLADRLSLVQPFGAVGFAAPIMNIMDVASEKKEEAFSLVYQNCPHIQFGHFVANATILEAFEGESFFHVVDLGMTLGLQHGQQWLTLIHSLAKRSAGGQPPCHLRITGVGLSVDRFQIIGDELKSYAKSMGIKFEFSVVKTNLEKLQPQDIKLFEGEVLVVNSILQLHCVVKESRGALNSVLQLIHKSFSPKLLVLVEQDSSHNGPFFLGRFMEALHYYSAIFDSLDTMLPKYDTKRAKMEQFYFAEEIKNIVSCEGPARVERHEKVDQWRRRLSRAGFQAAPIKQMAQAKQWLGKNKAFEGYTIVEDKGSLVLGWKSRPIVAVSCWKC
jgi:hypothetical protein